MGSLACRAGENKSLLQNASYGLAALKALLDAILADTGTTLEAKLDTIDSIVDAIRTELTFQHQPDALITQADPVSGQWYTVLDTTANVRIISIEAYVTWATTQPTPLQVRLTMDGNLIIHGVANPVSYTSYYACLNMGGSEAEQALSTTTFGNYRAFLYECRSVKVEVRITWATTQPTPLFCRLKYAKR